MVKRNTFINSSLKYLVRDLKEQKPSTIFVVPAFLEMFYKQIMKTVKKNGREKDLEKGIKISNILLKVGIDIRKKLFKDILESFGGELSYIICGGAYLDTKYIKFFRSIGIEVLNAPNTGLSTLNLFAIGGLMVLAGYETIKIYRRKALND